MKISYSSFNTFNLCPLKFKLGYIDRIKTPEKPEFFFGSLIHEVVQNALRQDPIIPTADELLKYYRDHFHPEVFKTELDAKQYLELGEKMIRHFHDNHKPALRNIMAIEKRFQIPLNDKHILSGVIDRVDKLPIGAFEVIDYKTSKKLPSQGEVDKDKQLCTYNLAIETLWPDAKDIRLTLYFLKHNEQISTTRRGDEVEAIKEELIQTAENIEHEENWKPKQNPLCDWCEYGNLCPLQKHKFQNQNSKVKSQNEIGIDTIINDYLAAREKIDDLEPKIHAHFDKEKIEKYYHKNGNVLRTQNGKLSISKY